MTTSTQTKSPSQNKEFLQKINILVGIALDNIDDLLDDLGIDYKQTNKRIYGPCPIHNGDNHSAWNLYPTPHPMNPGLRGNWQCRTHNCHNQYGKYFTGFIRGVLSSKNGYEATFNDVLKYLCQFTGTHLKDIKVDKNYEEQQSFIQVVNTLSNSNGVPENHIPRDKVQRNLAIPSKYYLERGYSKEILEKYDVGDCTDVSKRMRYRAVVPIYNDDRTHMIGCTGRSVFDKCSQCKGYHKPGRECPEQSLTKFLAAKWLHNKGFQAENHLYNYWFAKKIIEKTNTAILVEGPGDVWKLEEAGIGNSLAIFGTELNTGQLIQLECTSIMSLIVLMDNDDAGRIAAENIKKKCQRLFRMYFPKINKEDVGELNVDDITKEIKPLINRIEKLWV